MASNKIPTGLTTTETSIPVNPEVEKRLDKLNRVEILLEQDEDKIKEFCSELPNEDSKSFKKRKETYNKTFINMTQDLVSAPVTTVFSQGYGINYDNKDKSVIKEFNKNVVRANEKIPIEDYMSKYVGLYLRSFGTVCTIIDKSSHKFDNKKEEIDNGGLPYLNNIRIQDIINWKIGPDGKFEWFVYQKTHTDDWSNPFVDDPPETIMLECMYTRQDYIVREQGDTNIRGDLSYSHQWGFVPVVVQGSFLLHQNDILGNAAMFQSSNMIINANDKMNVGNYELDKHGSALLMMHTDAITGSNTDLESDGEVKTKKHDTNSLMIFDGEVVPEYLVKELQVQMIMTMAEKYFLVAAENERDLKSVVKKGTTGQEVQESGFAKVMDRSPLVGNLVSLSEDITIWYTKITDAVAKIMKKDNDSTLKFDTDYNMKSVGEMYDDILKAIKAELKDVSITLLKEQYRDLSAKIINDPEILKEVNKEIDEWDPDAIAEEIENSLNSIKGDFNNFGKKKEANQK